MSVHREVRQGREGIEGFAPDSPLVPSTSAEAISRQISHKFLENWEIASPLRGSQRHLQIVISLNYSRRVPEFIFRDPFVIVVDAHESGIASRRLAMTWSSNISRFVRHAHDARGEFAEHVHEIVLRGDDRVDGFVGLRRFVQAAAQ
jgi:hypothetical protein